MSGFGCERRATATAGLLVVALSGCADEDDGAQIEPPALACRAPVAVTAPACGAGSYDRRYVIAGPAEAGHDVVMAAAARRRDRAFHAIAAHTTGLNTELSVPDEAARGLIDDFVTGADGWDFEDHHGVTVESVVGGWHKVAGAYGGAGVAADAFRYGTLRDQGAACEEVDKAREQLIRGLDGLHLATAITGVEGIIARGFMRTDVPGDGQSKETTPLFDADGNALPADKTNGTWREDNSGGLYPNYVWEDSCSRDQLAGWALGYGSAWEVLRGDDSVSDELKSRLQADAAAIARGLLEVRERGYDLEIRDADGRLTFHGIMNENSIDRLYVEGADNGFHAILALGIVAAFAYVAEDPHIDQGLHGGLVAERGLHLLARDSMAWVNLGVASNYSNYNMAFVGGWLAYRYLCDEEARAVIGEAVATSLYAVPGDPRQPDEQQQTLYDFVHAVVAGGGTAFGPVGASLDQGAMDRGLETLVDYPVAPFWRQEVLNCDDQEIASGSCIGLDGTPLELLGYVGRGDNLVAAGPVPMRIRPHSNYYWRSNPYEVNGDGNGTQLMPAVDYRIAYWLGRWQQR